MVCRIEVQRCWRIQPPKHLVDRLGQAFASFFLRSQACHAYPTSRTFNDTCSWPTTFHGAPVGGRLPRASEFEFRCQNKVVRLAPIGALEELGPCGGGVSGLHCEVSAHHPGHRRWSRFQCRVEDLMMSEYSSRSSTFIVQSRLLELCSLRFRGKASSGVFGFSFDGVQAQLSALCMLMGTCGLGTNASSTHLCGQKFKGVRVASLPPPSFINNTRRE